MHFKDESSSSTLYRLGSSMMTQVEAKLAAMRPGVHRTLALGFTPRRICWPQCLQTLLTQDLTVTPTKLVQPATVVVSSTPVTIGESTSATHCCMHAYICT